MPRRPKKGEAARRAAASGGAGTKTTLIERMGLVSDLPDIREENGELVADDPTFWENMFTGGRAKRNVKAFRNEQVIEANERATELEDELAAEQRAENRAIRSEGRADTRQKEAEKRANKRNKKAARKAHNRSLELESHRTDEQLYQDQVTAERKLKEVEAERRRKRIELGKVATKMQMKQQGLDYDPDLLPSDDVLYNLGTELDIQEEAATKSIGAARNIALMKHAATQGFADDVTKSAGAKERKPFEDEQTSIENRKTSRLARQINKDAAEREKELFNSFAGRAARETVLTSDGTRIASPNAAILNPENPRIVTQTPQPGVGQPAVSGIPVVVSPQGIGSPSGRPAAQGMNTNELGVKAGLPGETREMKSQRLRRELDILKKKMELDELIQDEQDDIKNQFAP